MKILFICKHNRFRSKVAEALFKKYDKKKNEAKSAGMTLDLSRPYICENVQKTLKKKGIKKVDEQACKLKDYDLKWADKIIVVSDNIPRHAFPKEIIKKIEFWDVEDADECEKEKINEIVDNIEKRVRRLGEDIYN